MLLLLLNNVPSVSLEVSLLSNSNSFYNSSVNTGTQSLPSVGNSPLAGTPIAGSFFKTASVYTLTTSLFDNSKLVASPKGGATNFGSNIFGSNGFAGAFSNSYYASISVLTTTTVILYPSTISSSNIIYSSTVNNASQVVSVGSIISSTNVIYSSSIFSTTTLTSSLFVNVNSTYTNSLTTFKTLTGTTYTNNNTTYPALLQYSYSINPELYTNTNYYYEPGLYSIVLYTTTHINLNYVYPHNISSVTSNNIYTELYSNNNYLFSPSLNSVLPEYLDTSNLFYTHSISLNIPVDILPELYSNSNDFYVPYVNSLLPEYLDTSNTFYIHNINVNIPEYIYPNLYSNSNKFNAINLLFNKPVYPTTYYNVNYLYSAKIGNTLLPTRYSNTNSFYTAAISTGSKTLQAALYTRVNIFNSINIKYAQNIEQNTLVNINNIYYDINLIYNYNVSVELFQNTNDIFFVDSISNYIQIAKPTLLDNSAAIKRPVNTFNTYDSIFGSTGFSGGFNTVEFGTRIYLSGNTFAKVFYNSTVFYTASIKGYNLVNVELFDNNYVLKGTNYYTNTFGDQALNSPYSGTFVNLYSYNDIEALYLYSLRTYLPLSRDHKHITLNKSKSLKPLTRTNYSVSVKSNGAYSSYSRNTQTYSLNRNTYLKSFARNNVFIGKKTVSTSSTSYIFKASSRTLAILVAAINRVYKPVHYFVNRLIESEARNNIFVVPLLNNYFKFSSKSRSNIFVSASRNNVSVSTSRTRKYLTGKRVI